MCADCQIYQTLILDHVEGPGLTYYYIALQLKM